MMNLIPSSPNDRNPIPAFDPVPRKYRYDGWTAARQRAFIDALAELGSVKAAAHRINMSPEGAYYLRRQPGAEGFRAAWIAALDHGVQRLTDIAIDRATEGVPTPIFWRGEQVGEKRAYNDKLLMFILKHHRPESYGAGPTAGVAAKSPELVALESEDAWRQHQQKRQAGQSLLFQKLAQIRSGFKKEIAHDPAKRAAWDLLVGPTDWDNLDYVPSDDGMHTENMHRPDMILSITASEEAKARAREEAGE